MPVTCFITAETVQDRTSWRKIQYNQDGLVIFVLILTDHSARSIGVSPFKRNSWIAAQENDVIFKYQSQMEEAFQNQAVWKQRPVAWLTSDGVLPSSVWRAAFIYPY